MAGERREDDDDEDPQLKSLRQVWLSMRDEDPPTRGLDALMAAARSHVDVLAKPTLWQRIVAALRSPPILALATVMILIGGVVLFTRHSDELEKAPTAPAPLDRSKPAVRDLELHSEPTTTPPAKLVVPDPADKEVQHPPTLQPPHPVSRPRTTSRPRESPPLTDDSFAAGQNHDAMPRPAGHGTLSGASEEKLDGKKDTKAPTPPNEVLVEQLATQARSAATRGDCETARSIGARIARQDASYYRDHVAGDLSACTATTTLDAH
jgi:hypothetical protein